MGLLDDLSLEAKRRTCKVQTVAQEMDDKDRAIFLDAVMDLRWPAKRLEGELKKRNVQISDTPINAHRGKTCSCWKI